MIVIYNFSDALFNAKTTPSAICCCTIQFLINILWHVSTCQLDKDHWHNDVWVIFISARQLSRDNVLTLNVQILRNARCVRTILLRFFFRVSKDGFVSPRCAFRVRSQARELDKWVEPILTTVNVAAPYHARTLLFKYIHMWIHIYVASACTRGEMSGRGRERGEARCSEWVISRTVYLLAPG